MIQRLQSIYLLAICVISAVLVLADVPFYKESGFVSNQNTKTSITIDYNSTETINEHVGDNDGLVYFLGATALLAFVSIFLYRKRKLQLKLVMGLFAMVVVVVVGMYSYTYGKDYTQLETERQLLTGAFVPLSMIILAILAYRGIRRDEKLIRSLDRIR